MKKNNSRKKTIWAWDTEDDSHGNPYMFVFYNGVDYHIFKKDEDALHFLVDLDGKNEFWACNASYDLGNLFKNENLQFLHLIFAGSRLITAQTPDGQLSFKDTLNHWKLGVKEMGERIGLKKLEVKNENFNDEIYCKRDTEIVYIFVSEMNKKYKSIGARLKSTIGGTALDLYDRVYSPMVNEPLPKNILEYLKNALYGGRTECFFNAPISGKIQCYDYNSLYPSVMHDNAYPDISYFEEKIDLNLEGVSHVTVISPDSRIPYLPYRFNSALCFPIGRFSGFYTNFELRRAIDLGYEIEKIHSGVVFPNKTYYPFKNFVSIMYKNRLEAKKNGDNLLQETYKLLMNNLFGKFGQSNEKTKIIPYEKTKEIENLLKTTPCEFLNNGQLLLVKELGDYPKHTNYIWAAYTTAYGRNKLYNSLVQCDENAKLLYCDTDSVFFESKKTIFKDSKELGAFKLENTFEFAYFKGLKNYKLIDIEGTKFYKVRGVPKKQAAEFFETKQTICRKPNKLRETLRRNSQKGKKLIVNEWIDIIKKENKEYDKRIVLKGGETKPIYVDESQLEIKPKKKREKK